MVEFDKKMAENKKEVTFKDTSLAAKYKDNEAVKFDSKLEVAKGIKDYVRLSQLDLA